MIVQFNSLNTILAWDLILQFWPQITRFSRLFCLITHMFWPLLQGSPLRVHLCIDPLPFLFFFSPVGGCDHPERVVTPVGPVGPHRLRYVTLRAAAFLFRSRSVVSLRLTPGSLTTPFGGGTNPLRGLVTRRLMRAHACAYTCELQFWPV